MAEEKKEDVPESGTKNQAKETQTVEKKKTSAKKEASLGEQYLGALFKCASWISPAYKEMAEKEKGNLAILKELYLCSCDGVPEEKAFEALDKEKPETRLRFIRQKCLEERATKGYDDELKEIRKMTALVKSEMKEMKEKLDVITENAPSMNALFPEKEPEVDAVEKPAEEVTGIISKRKQASKKSEQKENVPESGTDESVTEKQKKKWSMKIQDFISSLRKSHAESIREYVADILEEGYSDEQLSFLLDCIDEGETPERIRKYASPKLPVKVMKRLKMMEEREEKEDGKR